MRNLKNIKSAGINGVTERFKNKGEIMVNWIWKLCNKVFVEEKVLRNKANE